MSTIVVKHNHRAAEPCEGRCALELQHSTFDKFEAGLASGLRKIIDLNPGLDFPDTPQGLGESFGQDTERGIHAAAGRIRKAIGHERGRQKDIYPDESSGE